MSKDHEQNIVRQPGVLRNSLPGYEPTPAYLKAVLSNQTQVGVQKDHYDPEAGLAGVASLEGDREERERFKSALAGLMWNTHKEVMRRPFNIDPGFLARIIVTHQLLSEDMRPSNSPKILVKWAKESALRGRKDDWSGNLHFHAMNTAFLIGGNVSGDILEDDVYDDRFDITAVMIATQQSLPKGAEFFSRWVDHRLKIADMPAEEIADKVEIAFFPSTLGERYGSDGLRTFIGNVAGRLGLLEIPENLEELITVYRNTDITMDWNSREVEAHRVNRVSEKELAKWLYDSLKHDDYSPRGGNSFVWLHDVYNLLGPTQQKIIRHLTVAALSDMANNRRSKWEGYAADHLLRFAADILIEYEEGRAEAIPHLLKIVEDPRFIPDAPSDLNKWDSFDFHLRTMQTLIGLRYSPEDQDFWKRLYYFVPNEHRNEESYRGLITSALSCYGLKPALDWVVEISESGAVVSNLVDSIAKSVWEHDTDKGERKAALEGILPQLPGNLANRLRRAIERVEKDLLES